VQKSICLFWYFFRPLASPPQLSPRERAGCQRAGGVGRGPPCNIPTARSKLSAARCSAERRTS
jgi:hypothetical protein